MLSNDIRAKYGRDEMWRAWIEKIPAVKFPRGLSFKVIPPFGGAAARFIAKNGDARVSVYLDMDGSLGCMEEPYWEIYPAVHGDTERYLMADWRDMMKGVQASIRKQLRRTPTRAEAATDEGGAG